MTQARTAGKRYAGRWQLLALALGGGLALFLLASVLTFNALPKPLYVQAPLQPDYGIDDPRFERAMDHLFGRPFVEGNSIDILENGEQIYPAMIEAIAAARSSISFETYEFWGEQIGQEMAEALAKAAARGVAVHAIIDHVGSLQAAPEKFELMRGAGVELVRWREPSWYQLSRLNHRTHRKLLIVDGRVGFTGGANIADNWVGTFEDGAYRDNHYRITGPVVHQLQGSFQQNWLRARGALLLDERYFPELEATGTLPMQVVDSFPREGHHQVREMVLLALAVARESIRIGTAYFYPDPVVLDALARAAERGVEVDILVPGESIDKGFIRHASINRWGEMLEAGVRIHEYQPVMYHAKLIIIDRHWVSIGSTNMDNRSFRINDETNVNILDRDLAERLVRQFESDLADATPYGLERWQERAWHKRLAGWITMTIGAHL